MRAAVKPWLERADEDLRVLSSVDVARAPHDAAVLAQQAVEKYLKACWIELGSPPPLTHDLEELWIGVETQVKLTLNVDGLIELTPYGTTSRYPRLRVTAEAAHRAARYCLETCAKLKSWLEARP